MNFSSLNLGDMLSNIASNAIKNVNTQLDIVINNIEIGTLEHRNTVINNPTCFRVQSCKLISGNEINFVGVQRPAKIKMGDYCVLASKEILIADVGKNSFLKVPNGSIISVGPESKIQVVGRDDILILSNKYWISVEIDTNSDDGYRLRYREVSKPR